MRKRTILQLAIAALAAAFVAGVAGVVVLALLNPGNKGPHISDEGIAASFFVGAFLGGSTVVVVYRVVAAWRKRRA